jgi:hypothetical protein
MSGINLELEPSLTEERLATCCGPIVEPQPRWFMRRFGGRLVHRNARRHLAAEPEPECSDQGFESLLATILRFCPLLYANSMDGSAFERRPRTQVNC